MYVSGIDWTARVVEDYEGAQQFFIDKLGLPLALEGKKSEMSHFRFPSGQLMELYGPGNRRNNPKKFRWFKGHALGLDVPDVEGARQELLEKGVRFTTGIETWKEDSWSMFLGPEKQLLQIQTPSDLAVKKEAQFSGYSWFAMPVRIFKPAVEFFHQILEMSVYDLDHSQTVAEFRTDDGHMLQVIGPNHPWCHKLKGMTVGFTTPDISQVKKDLQGRGVRFLSDSAAAEGSGHLHYFVGPEDYPYALWQPDKK